MKIGLLGGTFNPIHNGHLIIAEYVREYYSLDKIIFIPVGIPSHRENNLVNKESRFEMVKDRPDSALCLDSSGSSKGSAGHCGSAV